MSYETLTGGLELVLPLNGTTNWGTIVRNSTWAKINNHSHTGSGDGELLTGASLVDYSIDSTKLTKNISATIAPMVTVVAGVNTAVIDWNNGTKITVDSTAADGAVTPTFNNPVAGAKYRLTILQGTQLWTWPANVKWPGDEEPTQHSDDTEEIVVEMDYDGTNFVADWQLYNY